MKSRYFIFALLGLIFTTAFAGSGLDEALEASKKDGKPVLIDFYAVWCGPCKMFTREAKTEQEVKAALDQVHLVKLDAEHDGKEIADKFQIKGYPTFVLLNQEGKSFYRFWGYEKKFFLEELAKGMQDRTPYEQRISRYATEKGLNDGISLANYYTTRGEDKETLNLYEEILANHPEAPVKYELFSVKAQLRGEDAVDFKTLQELARDLLGSSELDQEKTVSLAQTMLHLAKKEKQPEVVGSFLDAGIKAAEALSSESEWASTANRLKAERALYISKDETAAVGFYKATLAEGWQENPSQINSFSWWCFENKVNLKEGRDLAKKAVSMAEAASDKAMIMDTQAELENVLGNPAEAVRIMEEAVKLDDKDYYKEQLERFRKISSEATGAGR